MFKDSAIGVPIADVCADISAEQIQAEAFYMPKIAIKKNFFITFPYFLYFLVLFCSI